MRFRYATFAFMLAASSLAGREVSVTLKNGKVFEGTVVSEDAKFVVLNSGGTDVRVLKAIIAEVDGAAYTKGDKILAGSQEKPAADEPSRPRKAAPKPRSKSDERVRKKLESLQTGQPIAIKLANGKIKRGKVVLIKPEYLTLDAGPSTIRIFRRDVVDLKKLRSEKKEQPAPPAPATASSAPEEERKPAETDTDDLHSIVLKNGTTFKGTVVSSSANFISFDINGRQVNILKAIIDKMDGRPYREDATVGKKEPTQVAQAPATKEKPRRKEKPSPVRARREPAPSTETEQEGPAKAKKPSAPEGSKVISKPSDAQSRAAEPVPESGKPTAHPGAPEPKEEKADSLKQPRKDEETGDSQQKQEMRTQVAMAPVKNRKPVSVTEGLDKSESALAEELSRDVRAQIERLRYKELEERIKAAARLKKMGPEAGPAAPHLVELLGDTTVFEPSRREKKKYEELGIAGSTPADQALAALLAIGEPAVTPLMKALSTIEESDAVSSTQDPRSVSPVIGALKHKDALLRQNVVRALGAIRDPRAIPLLLKVLDEDTNPSVLEKTERALKKLTDIPTLIEGLKSEHPVVQDNATYVLWLMTAKDFKQDYDKWKQWWEKQQGSKE